MVPELFTNLRHPTYGCLLFGFLGGFKMETTRTITNLFGLGGKTPITRPQQPLWLCGEQLSGRPWTIYDSVSPVGGRLLSFKGERCKLPRHADLPNTAHSKLAGHTQPKTHHTLQLNESWLDIRHPRPIKPGLSSLCTFVCGEPQLAGHSVFTSNLFGSLTPSQPNT